MIKAVAFRVVIRPDPVEERTKSGLILAVDKKLEKGATDRGTIVEIGPDVYSAFKTTLPFGGLVVGQRVAFAKYSGKWVEDEETQENFLVVNDEDIVTILEGKTTNDSIANVETKSPQLSVSAQARRNSDSRL